VQSDSGEQSFVINGEQVTQLATNGRSVYALQSLVPGASSIQQDFQIPTSTGGDANVSFNGLRQGHNLWLIDGGESADRGGAGGSIVMPSLDAISEFRTMTSNAEQLKHELAAMNEMSGPVFKVTNDPRVTPVGKFLRKWSLDELPQLINVLRGEMSLVGPRPLPVDEVRRFSDLAHRRRLSVKPGLTCLWQVKGRNQISDFKEWVRLDLEYIDNWSLWLDLQILLRTIPAVLRGTGAK